MTRILILALSFLGVCIISGSLIPANLNLFNILTAYIFSRCIIGTVQRLRAETGHRVCHQISIENCGLKELQHVTSLFLWPSGDFFSVASFRASTSSNGCRFKLASKDKRVGSGLEVSRHGRGKRGG